MDSVSGKSLVAAASSKRRRERIKKEDQCKISAASNQENYFLNMDLLSMSMVLDMVGLGGTLAVGQSCRRAKGQVQSYFRDCGPANVVQKDINFWLKKQDQEEISQQEVNEAIQNDYFLSLKTFLVGRGSLLLSQLGKQLVDTCFKSACRLDYLKLVKWILANFEIERESLFLNGYSSVLIGACCNVGPNSLAIIELLCRIFAITKDELLNFGCTSSSFPVMKYFFEHFDLTGDDFFEWRVYCLRNCCEDFDLESLKYLVEIVGLTAAEGLSEWPLSKAFSHKDLAFVQYYVDAFHVTSNDVKNIVQNNGQNNGRQLRPSCLENAKWIIERFNLDRNDLFHEDDIHSKYGNLEMAAEVDVEWFEYYIKKFGITEEELRHPDDYYCWVLNGALTALFKKTDYSTIEWMRNHWSILSSDFRDLEYLRSDFYELLREIVYLQPGRYRTNSDNRAILLYLFEKLSCGIDTFVDFGNDGTKLMALCRTLVRKGWLRFAKCIVGSWVLEAGPKLTNMVTTAARWGKFAIVKYFIDQGLYQLPNFIHLHHSDDKLKLSRDICEKLVREADTNVEFDFGLTDSQFEELQYLYRRNLDQKCYFAMMKYFIGNGLYQLPSFSIHLSHDNDGKLNVPRELCENFVRQGTTNMEFDGSLEDNQIEELRGELNSVLADEADDGFESDYEERSSIIDDEDKGDYFRDDFKGYFKDDEVVGDE